MGVCGKCHEHQKVEMCVCLLSNGKSLGLGKPCTAHKHALKEGMRSLWTCSAVLPRHGETGRKLPKPKPTLKAQELLTSDHNNTMPLGGSLQVMSRLASVPFLGPSHWHHMVGFNFSREQCRQCWYCREPHIPLVRAKCTHSNDLPLKWISFKISMPPYVGSSPTNTVCCIFNTALPSSLDTYLVPCECQRANQTVNWELIVLQIGQNICSSVPLIYWIRKCTYSFDSAPCRRSHDLGRLH